MNGRSRMKHHEIDGSLMSHGERLRSSRLHTLSTTARLKIIAPWLWRGTHSLTASVAGLATLGGATMDMSQLTFSIMNYTMNNYIYIYISKIMEMPCLTICCRNHFVFAGNMVESEGTDLRAISNSTAPNQRALRL